jgi:hypothetical protein
MLSRRPWPRRFPEPGSVGPAARETTIAYRGGTNQAMYAYAAAKRLTSVADCLLRCISGCYLADCPGSPERRRVSR